MTNTSPTPAAEAVTVKRWSVFPPDDDRVIRASDHDATLAALKARWSDEHELHKQNVHGYQKRIAQLEAALRMYMQVGDQCSRGYLGECEAIARALLRSDAPAAKNAPDTRGDYSGLDGLGQIAIEVAASRAEDLTITPHGEREG